MYIIVKDMGSTKVILSINSEIWEFDSREDALNIAIALTQNSDSGYTYDVKKIGE